MKTNRGIEKVAANASAYASANDVDWEAASTAGYWMKRLYDNPDTGERTWLVRADPGARSEPHAHDVLEQVYVLEGTFFDGERTLGPGDFCCRAPGAVHSGNTESGALMLVVYARD